MHNINNCTQQIEGDIPSSDGNSDRLLFDKSSSDNRNEQAFAGYSVS